MPRWIVAALIATALGCAARRPPPEAAPETTTEVEVTVDPLIVNWRESVEPAAMGPSEPGFVFCCGDGRYKMEIDCAEGVKRCYEQTATGAWTATYGRHCKRELGEACYLEICDERCQ